MLFLLIFTAYTYGVANPHVGGSPKYIEHAALFDLQTSASHVAAQNGPWTSPSTWAGGQVPGDGADVNIPQGISVSYESESSAALKTVLVEGELHWATTVHTLMRVDTLMTAPGSRVSIGTQSNPVTASARISIIDTGPIDITWDPTLISRGIISHGSFSMHGMEKTAHLKVAQDPMMGATSLQLATTPQGWQIGDKLVIAGTHYDGYNWDNAIRATRHWLPEDEVVNVTSVSGTTVGFTPALRFDHDSPRADLKTSVANFARTVKIYSEGASSAVSRLGHVMFMHWDIGVDIRYAEFLHLGRTDKSQLAMDISRVSPVRSDSNIKGRYALHLHRFDIPQWNQQHTALARVIGCSVHGTPGWGFVHHDSNALFSDNCAYDCFGACYASETGNEVGLWQRNIAIYSKGIGWGNPKNMVSLEEFDTGNSGDCFWFQSRMVRSIDNIAASCDSGFAYFHRGKLNTPEGASQISYKASVNPLPDALGMRDSVNPDDSPIRGFLDNEAFACNHGVFVVKANPHQGHDVHTHMKDLVAWNVRTGAFIEYTAHYLLENFDVIGRNQGLFSARAQRGIGIGNNMGDVVLKDCKITNFPVGIWYNAPSNPDGPIYWDRSNVVLNPEFISVETDFEGRNATHNLLLTSADVTQGRFQVVFDQQAFYNDVHPGGRKVVVTGVKTDGIGPLRIPPSGDTGFDDYGAGQQEIISRLETQGYFFNGSHHLVVLPDYYTDRLSGELQKLGRWVVLDETTVASRLGNQFFSYRNAVSRGNVTTPNGAPTTSDDSASTTRNTLVNIDVLSNDQDADGDALRVDGVQQPDHGVAYVNTAGEITYVPDYGWEGTTTFSYWASDSHANFVKARVTVVVADMAPPTPSSPINSSPAAVPTTSTNIDSGAVAISGSLLLLLGLMLNC